MQTQDLTNNVGEETLTYMAKGKIEMLDVYDDFNFGRSSPQIIINEPKEAIAAALKDVVALFKREGLVTEHDEREPTEDEDGSRVRQVFITPYTFGVGTQYVFSTPLGDGEEAITGEDSFGDLSNGNESLVIDVLTIVAKYGLLDAIIVSIDSLQEVAISEEAIGLYLHDNFDD